ncbi:mannose-ethanolamine phosphotransferase [Martiniozyma asiatica (nom. inval.)]|nr:mannose-ethanolamine phosphotransferase [Martiniozyma asiatica]
MQPMISTQDPPAKRLFLIVGDGQRADKTLGKQLHPVSGEYDYLSPFLRSVILNEGTYGLSHTRMPTESRPGHVAMIAGFYEDVSAVTKGWKENPVDFDSVFNRSTHTYSFGSPDILPMFAQGATPGKIDTWMYGHEFEDFSKDSIELDKFVFDHLYQLFDNSTHDAKLNKEIRQNGNIFFLHLLGTDTAGHSYRPYSAEYYNNIMHTDEQIEKLVKKVNNFFGDKETAFIFTADHGMSDFGSHGDGHPNNTRTPLICWGKGCNKPKFIKPENNLYLLDEFENKDMLNWDLNNIQRNDVKQADIAPLMSYLIGIDYPVNNVGQLPLNFINHSEELKIKGLFSNCKSLLEQYIVKEEEVMSIQFNFKSFPKFEIKSIAHYKMEIENLIAKIKNNSILDFQIEEIEIETIKLIQNFNNVILEGLDYLQKYNWLMLRSIVTMGFIGWIIYSFIIFLQLFIIPVENQENKKFGINFNKFLFGIIGLSMSSLFYYQKSPINYYFYLLFPIYFWHEIISLKSDLIIGFNLFFNGLSTVGIIGLFLFIIIFFESIAIGFTNREVFSIMYLMLSIYPFILFKRDAINFKNIKLTISWILTCCLLSIFPIQDPVKIESLNLIILSGFLMILIGLISFVKFKNKMSIETGRIILFQITLILISIYSTTKSIISLTNRDGLPKDSQLIGWTILILSLLIGPMLHFKYLNNNYSIRFLSTFLTLAPTFVILTISFEGLFYILFSAIIYQWILIENKNKENFDLIRITLIGFFNLQIAFFGTGNISSISTFSLDSVYRLMPIFDPFPMGALLMIKLIIPYILLSVGIGLLNIKMRLKKYSISILVICICDLLSLWFFYQVKTEGSWLMIGVSISNYCLAIFGSLFIGIVEVASGLLLGGVVVEEDQDLDQQEQESNKQQPKTEKKKRKSILDQLKQEDSEYIKIVQLMQEEDKNGGDIASRVRRRNKE